MQPDNMMSSNDDENIFDFYICIRLCAEGRLRIKRRNAAKRGSRKAVQTPAPEVGGLLFRAKLRG